MCRRLRRRQRERGIFCIVALAWLLLECRQAQPPPFPGSAAAIAVRVLPGTARVASVLATAGGGVTTTLRALDPGGEIEGELALAPGAHVLSVVALGPDGARLAGTTVPLATRRGEAALVSATLLAPGAPARVPVIEALVAPLASLVVGDRMPVDARLAMGAAGAAATWTAEPSGCGSFASAGSLSTEWTAESPGTCTLTLAAADGDGTDRRSVSVLVRSRGRGDAFPLRAEPGRRFLVDRRGAPFLIKGETAWLALVNLTEEEQELYLSDRAAKGFNLVEVMLMNHDYTSSPSPTPPANRYGEEPFLEPGHLSAPNDAYFDRVVRFVDRAAAHGIAVLVAPSYLGFDGGREGWWEVLRSERNGRATCFAFGRYVGTRLKDRANVLWLAGGDFSPPPGSEGEARHLEIVRGIKAAGAGQPWTGHWNVNHLGGISTDQALFRATMDLNGVYQYAQPWRYAARAYDARPARPTFLLESTYEHEHPAGETQPFRKAWWWTMVSGGSGVLWSNLFLWMCESARGTYRADYGDTDRTSSSWAAELDSPGTHEVLHLHALFEGLPWFRLVPAGPASGRAELVTSGRGRGRDRTAASATPEGDLVVAYVPPTGAAPRSFRIDLSGLRPPVRLRWYDPSIGAFVFSATVSTSREVALATPGTNGAGANDWVLVADTPAPRSASARQ